MVLQYTWITALLSLAYIYWIPFSVKVWYDCQHIEGIILTITKIHCPLLDNKSCHMPRVGRSVQWSAFLPSTGVKKTKWFPSSISFIFFLTSHTPHYVMATPLKVKEVDLSPAEVEPTSTQVCRACLLFLFFFFTSMLCSLGVAVDVWKEIMSESGFFDVWWSTCRVNLTCPYSLLYLTYQQSFGASEVAPPQVHTLLLVIWLCIWSVNHLFCLCVLVWFWWFFFWGEIGVHTTEPNLECVHIEQQTELCELQVPDSRLSMCTDTDPRRH